MKFRLPLLAAISVLGSSPFAGAAAILRITEVMSNGDTYDWFEVTNYGDAAAAFTGHSMDDSSFASGTSVGLVGITSIAPGESVIFIENSTVPAAFKTAWSLEGSVQVGNYSGSGAGLSSSGDGVTIFNGSTELSGPNSGLIRVSFGASTSGTSFNWTYNAAGNNVSGPTLTTGGTTWNNAGTTMRGTPGVVPEPSAMLLGGLGAMFLLRRRRREA